MNKMFIKIEHILRKKLPAGQRLTKVWMAEQLEESPQNLNNWENRRVPSDKIGSVASKLSVSRDYLENDSIEVEDVTHGLTQPDLSDESREMLEIFESLNKEDRNRILAAGLTFLASADQKK